MKEEILNSRKKANGSFLCILIISQMIFAVLILLTVTVIKFTSNGLYKKIKAEYKEKFSVETTVEQVLNGEDEDAV